MPFRLTFTLIVGIVYDGISDSDKITDEDYQADSTTISLSFAGFKSTLHGISSFVWAVGSSPGLEDIQSYTEIGVIPPEDQSTLNDGNYDLYIFLYRVCHFNSNSFLLR